MSLPVALSIAIYLSPLVSPQNNFTELCAQTSTYCFIEKKKALKGLEYLLYHIALFIKKTNQYAKDAITVVLKKLFLVLLRYNSC